MGLVVTMNQGVGRTEIMLSTSDTDNSNDFNLFSVMLKQLGIFGTKSLPQELRDMLVAQPESFRRHLLAGLIDSDGSVTEPKAPGHAWRYTFSQGTPITARNHNDIIRLFRELSWSLGFTCETYADKNHGLGDSSARVIAQINAPGTNLIPCVLERNRTPARSQVELAKTYCHRNLPFNIEPVGRDTYYGFELEESATNAAPHFLLANFVVAHNCFKVCVVQNLLQQSQYHY